MSERCPLIGDSVHLLGIPEVCMEQCGELWEEACRTQSRDPDKYEVYDDDDDDDNGEKEDADSCKHFQSECSYDNLQRPYHGDPSERIYSTVEACADCGSELGEDSYYFSCPYS